MQHWLLQVCVAKTADTGRLLRYGMILGCSAPYACALGCIRSTTTATSSTTSTEAIVLPAVAAHYPRLVVHLICFAIVVAGQWQWEQSTSHWAGGQQQLLWLSCR